MTLRVWSKRTSSFPDTGLSAMKKIRQSCSCPWLKRLTCGSACMCAHTHTGLGVQQHVHSEPLPARDQHRLIKSKIIHSINNPSTHNTQILADTDSSCFKVPAIKYLSTLYVPLRSPVNESTVFPGLQFILNSLLERPKLTRTGLLSRHLVTLAFLAHDTVRQREL